MTVLYRLRKHYFKHPDLNDNGLFTEQLTPLVQTMIVFETLISFYNTFNCFRFNTFFVHTLLVLHAVVREHIRELNSLLKRIISGKPKRTHLKNHQNEKNSAGQFEHYRLLRRFYQEYRYLLAILRNANYQLVSRILFTALVANLTFNLVTLSLLLFQRVAPSSLPERITLLMLACGQTFIAALCVSVLSSTTQHFYRSNNLLYRVQLMLGSCNNDDEGNKQNSRETADVQKLELIYRQTMCTTAKLKLAAFYETVLTTNEFRFTVGYLAKISWRTLYEFLIVYSGFVMYIAKLTRNGRL